MRWLTFIGLNISGLVIFYQPLFEFGKVAWNKPLYSHAFIVPLVSIYIIWADRKGLFSRSVYKFKLGGMLLVAGCCLLVVSKLYSRELAQNDFYFLSLSGFFTWELGSFITCFGGSVFRSVLFPLFFFGFIIPPPTFILEPFITLLQWGSANAVFYIFKLFGVPVFREGVTFSLPNVTIEVARQCSGIRSALALIIISVLLGNIFLKSSWRRLILVLAVLPITIFKNGLRIALLTLLGAYVDLSYLTDSSLHSQGGKPFLLLALLFLAPVLWLLRWSEKKRIDREINPTLKLNSQAAELNRGN